MGYFNQGNSSKINQLSSSLADKAQQYRVDITKFGAKGDYNGTTGTDNATAIQSALNYARDNGINSVFIPIGKYLVNGNLTVYSNITIEGQGDNSQIVCNTTTDNFFSGVGSLESTINLAATADVGTTTLTTATHNYATGDYLYLISQRNSLSVDAGENYRLGCGTANATLCYFGEFVNVSTVPSSTSVGLTGSVIFSNYKIDKTLETDANARVSSTVQRVNFIQNVAFKNFSILALTNVRLINFQYAFNCKVENVNVTRNGIGSLVGFVQSLNCVAKKCNVFYPIGTPVNAYDKTAFFIHSSQNCGIEDSLILNGSQCFDISYINGQTPSVNCYLKNNTTKYATTNGATSHPGTFGCSFENNQFLGCYASGLLVRGRNNRILNNRVVCSARGSSNYGICLSDGWARESLVSGNTIENSYYGLYIQDSSTFTDSYFKDTGAQIINNLFINNFEAIRVYTVSNNKWIGIRDINIVNNTFKNLLYPSSNGKCIRLSQYVCGVNIKGNSFSGQADNELAPTINYVIYLEANTDRIDITDNTFSNFTAQTCIVSSNPSDATAFPSTVNVRIKENKYYNCNTRYVNGASVVTADPKFNFLDTINPPIQYGTTANRPTINLFIGYPYYDTTLAKPIWCKQVSPAVWGDATGATV